ncbi:SDR family oxidoreductase [Pseudalkalibacillus caeni]|uniref:SDR family oxidoreductase n=1 Tax=Exobacillus caeni TaxID=2574798 RepID=UPI001FEA56D5|nr:SDR family oxidoreductase [Pseudalkalibacillus caeni]
MAFYSDLRGKTALITGVGRQKGIGAAICYKLAEAGTDIFFTYLTRYDHSMEWNVDDREPEEIKRAIKKYGVRCFSMEADLAEDTAPSSILDMAEEELGPVSILVNNAAYSTGNNVENLDFKELDAHYAVNVRGTIMLSLEFVRRFEKAAAVQGRIINLTSGQSRGPMPAELAYAATKGAVEAFTTSLSAGVASKGITVNAVNPGPTDTGWMAEPIKQQLISKFPLGRTGQPEDAARLIRFLASEEAEWITGQIIHSEGGFVRE